MEAKEMLTYVDHTQLKAFATWEDIKKLCEESIEFHTASVCIPPCYIKRVHDAYGDKINICTVVGFPLGYSVTAAKVAEVRQALADGANEIDMVINISDVKNGDIVLMHDIHRSTVQAAETIIPALKKRGFQMVTVSQLAKYKGKTTLRSGKTYYSFK